MDNANTFIVQGVTPSKSNCYMIITISGHGSLCKTKAMKAYEQNFFCQVPASLRNMQIDEPIKLTIAVYWESLRQDLDNCLKVVCDCLQGSGVIKNDNLVYEIVASKHKDKLNPRVEIKIERAMQSTPEEGKLI